MTVRSLSQLGVSQWHVSLMTLGLAHSDPDMITSVHSSYSKDLGEFCQGYYQAASCRSWAASPWRSPLSLFSAVESPLQDDLPMAIVGRPETAVGKVDFVDPRTYQPRTVLFSHVDAVEARVWFEKVMESAQAVNSLILQGQRLDSEASSDWATRSFYHLFEMLRGLLNLSKNPSIANNLYRGDFSTVLRDSILRPIETLVYQLGQNVSYGSINEEGWVWLEAVIDKLEEMDGDDLVMSFEPYRGRWLSLLRDEIFLGKPLSQERQMLNRITNQAWNASHQLRRMGRSGTSVQYGAYTEYLTDFLENIRSLIRIFDEISSTTIKKEAQAFFDIYWSEVLSGLDAILDQLAQSQRFKLMSRSKVSHLYQTLVRFREAYSDIEKRFSGDISYRTNPRVIQTFLAVDTCLWQLEGMGHGNMNNPRFPDVMGDLFEMKHIYEQALGKNNAQRLTHLQWLGVCRELTVSAGKLLKKLKAHLPWSSEVYQVALSFEFLWQTKIQKLFDSLTQGTHTAYQNSDGHIMRDQKVKKALTDWHDSLFKTVPLFDDQTQNGQSIKLVKEFLESLLFPLSPMESSET